MSSPDEIDRIDTNWRRTLAAAIWSGLIVVAAVVLSRRFSGEFSNAVSEFAACLVATLATGMSILACFLFHASAKPGNRGHVEIAAGIVTLAPPFVLAVALPWESTITGLCYLTGLLVFAATAIVIAGDSPKYLFQNMRCSVREPVKPEISAEFSATESLLAESQQGDDCNAAEESSATDIAGFENAAQWMTRNVFPDGTEVIDGFAHVYFSPGQKQTSIHLPFCPPLATAPTIECTVSDNAPVRTKVLAHPYGARIELRRSGTVDFEMQSKIEFSAVAQPGNKRAA